MQLLEIWDTHTWRIRPVYDVYDEDDTFVGHVSVERVDADWFNIGSKCHDVWSAWPCGGDTLKGNFTSHEEGPEFVGLITRGFVTRQAAEETLVAERRNHPRTVRVKSAKDALSPAARSVARGSTDEEWFVFEDDELVGSIVKRCSGWTPGRGEQRLEDSYPTRQEATDALVAWWRHELREQRETAWEYERRRAEAHELQSNGG